MKVNAALGDDPPIGGFNGGLPKDCPLPSWAFRLVGGKPETTLASTLGLVPAMLQIHCIGNTADDAITLANRIFPILQGFRGKLPDSDSTYVDCCLLCDKEDFEEDDVARTYRRMLEFDVFYALA